MRPKVDGDEMDVEVFSDLLAKRLPTGIRGEQKYMGEMGQNIIENKHKILHFF